MASGWHRDKHLRRERCLYNLWSIHSLSLSKKWSPNFSFSVVFGPSSYLWCSYESHCIAWILLNTSSYWSCSWIPYRLIVIRVPWTHILSTLGMIIVPRMWRMTSNPCIRLVALERGRVMMIVICTRLIKHEYIVRSSICLNLRFSCSLIDNRWSLHDDGFA